MTSPTVYLDHAATTPMVPAAVEAMSAPTTCFVPVSADDRRALDELARGVLRIRTEVE